MDRILFRDLELIRLLRKTGFKGSSLLVRLEGSHLKQRLPNQRKALKKRKMSKLLAVLQELDSNNLSDKGGRIFNGIGSHKEIIQHFSPHHSVSILQ